MVNCSLFLFFFFFKKQRQFSGEWKVFYQFMLEQLEVYLCAKIPVMIHLLHFIQN